MRLVNNIGFDNLFVVGSEQYFFYIERSPDTANERYDGADLYDMM